MRRALLATLSSLALAGGPPELIGIRTTLSGENLRLPKGEVLGLLGLSGTTDLGPWYLGPGLYGAARGDRGGVFTFGLEGGLRGRPFPALPLELEAGCFAGGGGGANAPQGSGLMLRPHLGLSYPLGRVRLGAQLSRVRFPGGDIDGTQAAFTVAFSAQRLWMPEGGWGPAYAGPVRWEGRSLELEAMHLDPARANLTRTGLPQRSFSIGGLAFSRDLSGPGFHFLSVGGAAKGSSSGYAQALAGLGFRASLVGPLGAEARLGAGLGGGGDVDTGGGFILSGEGALTAGSPHWRAALGLGFLRAPGGSYLGRMLTFRLAHRVWTPGPQGTGEGFGTFDLAQWRVGSGLLVYHSARRNSRADGTVQLMTLRADRLLGQNWYLTAESGSATGGNAGGYSTGLVGLGVETAPWARQKLFLETALGAGGGGSLRSGGGLLASLRGGWRWELPRGLGLEAAVGRVRAPHGDLDTTTAGLGLQVRFQSLER